MGGHVGSGETYDDAVRREIPQETGLTAEPFFLGSYKKRFIVKDKENVHVYGVVADRELWLNTEIIKGEYVTLYELEPIIEERDFLPETEILLPMYSSYLLAAA
jgi:8-oxo-dGTP pyrophosphatase MutT (NUDIX family)